MKSASHELKSLMRFYGSRSLRVPMMCIIDYHGYRLVAMSILPLKELLYGSGDAGAHIKADPHVHELMGEVAKRVSRISLKYDENYSITVLPFLD